MRPDGARHHLQRDVPPLGCVDEVAKLCLHHIDSANRAMEHVLIQEGQQLNMGQGCLAIQSMLQAMVRFISDRT